MKMTVMSITTGISIYQGGGFFSGFSAVLSLGFSRFRADFRPDFAPVSSLVSTACDGEASVVSSLLSELSC